MQLIESPLKGLFVIQPEKKGDSRGSFTEVLRMDLLSAAGINPEFVQMNHSTSAQNVLRGLHFQWDKPLSKYIRVINGSVFMAAVDIRKNSPTLGRHFTTTITAESRTCLWVPAGFATGFCMPEGSGEVEYLYTAYYNQNGESNILWNDPAIGVPWPLTDPVVSERDQKAGTMADWLKRPEADFFMV